MYAAYDIEKIVRYSDSAIFDNLGASWLSDLVFVRVQHFHASRVRNFHGHVQNAVALVVIRVRDAESLRLDPETKFGIGFDLGLSQQISADFVKLFTRDRLCPTVFTIV